eukprot:CAMPEP_0170340124 /NCGR_PEP_ID=MMETSP0116_2-20130129/71155_1 /TAXON_ID=400756 /ORGANISM="Durinskia baltica, Strain CSIRO CS-38" /LENGTH=80 /DNA_ID=CAMNT_0010593613 /DNA_START=38 /DNA_END=277 /DNA_ORIENTATION=+
MTLSPADGSDHLAVAFLDLANLCHEADFKAEQVELKTQAGTVAIADLHTAAQQRWAYAPVEQFAEAYFLDPTVDTQANTL